MPNRKSHASNACVFGSVAIYDGLMNTKLAQEILNKHADNLVCGQDVTEKLATQYPELASLLQIARTISHEYVMVPVSADFTHDLGHDLLRTPIALSEEDGIPTKIGWIIGAAAVGVGSAITGIILATRRHQTDSDPAETPSLEPVAA